jgi:hypothetical protein
MSKHIIKGFITHTTYPWSGSVAPQIGFAAMNTDTETYPHNEYTVGVAAHSFEVDIPDNFNPAPLKIAGLRDKIQNCKLAAFEECSKMEEEIQKLLCISYEAPAADTVFEEVPQEAIDLNTNTTGDFEDVPA